MACQATERFSSVATPLTARAVQPSDLTAVQDHLLRLSIEKARNQLGWTPVWPFARTIEQTARWYRGVLEQGVSPREACLADLDAYLADAALAGAQFAQA